MHENKGSCLCGKVTFSCKTVNENIGACHCGMCRKWVGGPLIAADCGQEVVFTGEEYIHRYDSSDWAQRGSCKSCGSSLFYFLKPKNQYIIPVGLFEQQESFNFDHQIFIDAKPHYYSFANDTKNMTGEEVLSS